MSDDLPSAGPEQITDTDPQVSATGTSKAIRGGAIRVLGFAAGALVSLGSATILVRHLGISSFGRYVTVTSLVALVAGVTEAGINVYGIREWVAHPEAKRRELLANLVTLRLILTTAGIACATCFGVLVGYPQVLVLGTLVAGFGLLIQVIIDVLSVSLQAQLELGRLSVVELFRRMLLLAIIGGLALADATLLPFLAASTIAGALALILLARIVRSSVAMRFAFDRHVWRELFVEILPFSISLSVAMIYLYVTVIIMSLIATAAQTGLFATSFRIILVALVIPGILLGAVFPLMARPRSEQEPRGDMIGKVFTVAVICGAWMSLTIAVTAPFIINVIGGSQARQAASVLQIQGAVLTAGFVSTSSSFNLVALRRYRPLIVLSASVLALNIVLSLVLVPALGAKGGALADVMAETVMAIGLTAALIRAVPQHQIKASVAPPVLLASALSASTLLVPLGSLARAVGATAIYFGVLLLMRAIPDEILNAARRLRPLRTPS